MVLPLFKSHYSLGRSILTLEKKETQLINGPDSIIDICLDHEIKDFYLVEDSMGSFLQAYSNTKDEDLSFYIFSPARGRCVSRALPARPPARARAAHPRGVHGS